MIQRAPRYHPPHPSAPFPPHIQAALEAAAATYTTTAPSAARTTPATITPNPASSSPSSQSGTSHDLVSPSRPLHYFPRHLHLPVYSCGKCLTPVALQDELVSKAFSGRSGRALLLHSTQNTLLGPPTSRQLLTGLHTVSDLLCSSCGTSLGWMYLKAMEREQEYKEGKYILEMARIVKENNYALSDDKA